MRLPALPLTLRLQLIMPVPWLGCPASLHQAANTVLPKMLHEACRPAGSEDAQRRLVRLARWAPLKLCACSWLGVKKSDIAEEHYSMQAVHLDPHIATYCCRLVTSEKP